MRIVVPNVVADNAVVRVRYVSQNPTENDRGTTFYQCADVKIVKATEKHVAVGATAAGAEVGKVLENKVLENKFFPL